MIIFGGSGRGETFSDAWIFNIEKKEWREIEVKGAPPERNRHSAVYDPANKQMLIFGGNGFVGFYGQANHFLDDTWIFDIEKKKWKEIDVREEEPPERYCHSAVYDPAGKQMFIFGGLNNTKKYLSDIWIFDIQKKEWKEIPSAEEEFPARFSLNAIYDSANKQIIMFGGGQEGRRFFSDIWIFDLEKKKWKEIKVKFKLQK